MTQNSIKNRWRTGIFAGLFMTFILLRMLNLLTAVESFREEEELYRGTIAQEIIRGLPTSLWNYQADEYSSGSIVIGLVAVPFFKFLGPSLLALKLVPLLFWLVSFCLLGGFLKRFFGDGPAI